MLSAAEARDETARLLDYHGAERSTLDQIAAYWTGRQRLPIVPTGAPREVQRLAQMSRINVIKLVVSTQAQNRYVDGYRDQPETEVTDEVWEIWQANRMDAHQTGVHRAALAYGVAYVIVLPGDPVPVIRGSSPRSLVAMYDEDSRDWPYFALEEVRSPWAPVEYRLYEADAVHTLEGDTPEWVKAEEHDLGVCPVVRFRNADTLNEPPLAKSANTYTPWPTDGEVEPLMPLQDQMDVTTFDLLVAQHFQSFRQRYIMGWTAEEEAVRAKASGASRLWTFADPDVKVGEFGQVDLGGYLHSREDTVAQLGVVSQTPGHELLGKMVNLSAEALVAAETGQRRKGSERQSLFGESWEQVFALASRAAGVEVSESAQVRWRDTESRSLSQTIDALGKLATMLGVPGDQLWERIPGVTQQDVERWRTAAEASDSIAMLSDLLTRQMGNGSTPVATFPAAA
jgi:hypothetical protein